MARETITINGKAYKTKEIDFNFVCELGLHGVDLTKLDQKTMWAASRQYIAYCMNVDDEIAGREIEEEIIGGGDITDIINLFGEKLEESRFFLAMVEKAKKTDTKRNTKKKETEQSE